jgi:hypothetical protein
MDSQTHVEFAAKLLAISGSPVNLSLLSLFPQIDRFPHTLHRVYAHTVFKARVISETGLRVLHDDNWTDPQHAYEVRRFKEEKPRLLTYLANQQWSLPGLSAVDREAALMSYVSHVYLDTYNQPAQPFAPQSIYCSGQWKLWEKIGDFRLALYMTPTINELRKELFAHELWNKVTPHSAVAIIQAMMARMCNLSLGKINEMIILPAMDSLKLEPLTSAEIASACEFLEEFENVLTQLHLKHLAPNTATVIQTSRFQPEHEGARAVA